MASVDTGRTLPKILKTLYEDSPQNQTQCISYYVAQIRRFNMSPQYDGEPGIMKSDISSDAWKAACFNMNLTGFQYFSVVSYACTLVWLHRFLVFYLAQCPATSSYSSVIADVVVRLLILFINNDGVLKNSTRLLEVSTQNATSFEVLSIVFSSMFRTTSSEPGSSKSLRSYSRHCRADRLTGRLTSWTSHTGRTLSGCND